MIRRIEIDKHGHVSLQFGERNRWCDISGFPPRELDPLKDSKIPLAAFARQRRLRILGYRPGRRLVAAGQLDGAETVWKGYRRGRGDRQARNYALAASALQGGEVRAPAIVGADSATDVVVMRREPGERPAVSADRAADFRLMGAGTRRLQAFRAGLDALGAFGRQHELAVLQERIRRLELAGGAPPEGWPGLRRSLVEASAIAPEAEKTLAHRDLHDGQWLVGRDRPCLLDFDLLCRAEPELDVANFLAHLELRRLQHPDAISAAGVNACSEAFLDGFGYAESPGERARLAFYQATTFARLALVYQLRPRWQHLASRLTELGQKRLETLRGASG